LTETSEGKNVCGYSPLRAQTERRHSKNLPETQKSTLHVNWHNNNSNTLKVARMEIKMEGNRTEGRKKEK
jgi:hypothetical protein